MNELVDQRGYSFQVGCKVVRAYDQGWLEICIVTKIEDGKLYLDNSKIPIRYPKRLIILELDPLYKMVKDYDNKK